MSADDDYRDEDYILLLPTPLGIPQWFDTRTWFLYSSTTDETGAIVSFECTTKDARGDLYPDEMTCEGQFKSFITGQEPAPHCHNDGVTELFLRKWVRQYAVLVACSLLGRVPNLEQFLVIYNYFTFIILNTGKKTYEHKHVLSHYRGAAERRYPHPPYPANAPLLPPFVAEPIEDIATLIELTIRLVYGQFGTLMEEFQPRIDFGYLDIEDLGLPDPTKPYQPHYPVPGNSYFKENFSF